MRKLLSLLMISVFILSFSGSVFAASESSKADAEAMVKKAISFIQEKGRDKALAEFNNPNGEFIKGELYVFAYDFEGTNKALAVKPEMIGKNLIDLKDADGKFVIKDLISVANNGGGWHQYKWENPTTQQVQDKASYVVKVDDSLWLGCGIYL